MSKELLPRSDSNEARDAIEKVFAERDWPVNPKAAARCGWEAARRYDANLQAAKPADSISNSSRLKGLELLRRWWKGEINDFKLLESMSNILCESQCPHCEGTGEITDTDDNVWPCPCAESSLNTGETIATATDTAARDESFCLPAETCNYPDCKCPFDAPADPNWCARGLPKQVAKPADHIRDATKMVDALGSLPVVATMAKGPVIYFTKPVENGLKDLPVGQYDLTPISYASAEIAQRDAEIERLKYQLGGGELAAQELERQVDYLRAKLARVDGGKHE